MQLGLWNDYDKYSKGIEYLLKSDFKKSKEILKDTISKEGVNLQIIILK